MRKDRDTIGVRFMCFVIFLTFTLCWLSIQRDLMVYTIRTLSNSRASIGSFGFLYISVLLICFVLSAVPISRSLFKYKNGQYACNYAISSFLLGCLAGFDGDCVFSLPYSRWIIGMSFLIFILVVPKIVSFFKRHVTYSIPKMIASNLMILFFLICITVVMGNTDENLHRRLRIEALLSKGEYEKVLDVGAEEEETDSFITLLRVKAMLGMDTAQPGTGVGEHLFLYPISDVDKLIDSLTVLSHDSIYDDCSIQIALAMLEMDIQRADSLIAPLILEKKMPMYYMQLLVMSGNNEAAVHFPEEYEAEQKNYENFNDVISQQKKESPQALANSTYLKYSQTYYWFYNFCR